MWTLENASLRKRWRYQHLVSCTSGSWKHGWWKWKFSALHSRRVFVMLRAREYFARPHNASPKLETTRSLNVTSKYLVSCLELNLALFNVILVFRTRRKCCCFQDLPIYSAGAKAEKMFGTKRATKSEVVYGSDNFQTRTSGKYRKFRSRISSEHAHTYNTWSH